MNLRLVKDGKNVAEKKLRNSTLHESVSKLLRTVDMLELAYQELKKQLAKSPKTHRINTELDFLRKYRGLVRKQQLCVKIQAFLSNKGGRPVKADRNLMVKCYVRFSERHSKPPSAEWLAKTYNSQKSNGKSDSNSISRSTAWNFLQKVDDSSKQLTEHDQKMIALMRREPELLMAELEKLLNEN
jgi:hypothetical protein